MNGPFCYVACGLSKICIWEGIAFLPPSHPHSSKALRLRRFFPQDEVFGVLYFTQETSLGAPKVGGQGGTGLTVSQASLFFSILRLNLQLVSAIIPRVENAPFGVQNEVLNPDTS